MEKIKAPCHSTLTGILNVHKELSPFARIRTLDRNNSVKHWASSHGVWQGMKGLGTVKLTVCRKQTDYHMHCVHYLRTGSASFSTSLSLTRAVWGRIISLHAVSVFQATLKHAIEDMFDSPGFLIAQVAATGPPPTEPPSATHGLDMAAVTNMYTSILRVNRPPPPPPAPPEPHLASSPAGQQGRPKSVQASTSEAGVVELAGIVSVAVCLLGRIIFQATARSVLTPFC